MATIEQIKKVLTKKPCRFLKCSPDSFKWYVDSTTYLVDQVIKWVAPLERERYLFTTLMATSIFNVALERKGVAAGVRISVSTRPSVEIELAACDTHEFMLSNYVGRMRLSRKGTLEGFHIGKCVEGPGWHVLRSMRRDTVSNEEFTQSVFNDMLIELIDDDC